MFELIVLPFVLLFYSPLFLLLPLGFGFLQFLLLYTAAALTDDRVIPRLLGLPLPLLSLMTALHFYGQLSQPVDWDLALFTDDNAFFVLIALYVLIGSLAGGALALHKNKPS